MDGVCRSLVTKERPTFCSSNLFFLFQLHSPCFVLAAFHADLLIMSPRNVDRLLSPRSSSSCSKVQAAASLCIFTLLPPPSFFLFLETNPFFFS